MSACARNVHVPMQSRLAIILVCGIALIAGCQGESISGRREASSRPERDVTSDGATPLDVDSSPSAGPPDFSALAERLVPSVVAVVTKSEPRAVAGGRAEVRRGIGAGIIVGPDEILTNDHVVASAVEVDVHFHDGTRRSAMVVHGDSAVDLALLRLREPPPFVATARIRAREPRAGEWVMAIGQPFGLSTTITVGVVSGVGRDYRDLGRPQGLRADGLWSFIQTDASINIGNSGGPLVDLDGDVVGIITAVRRDGQGLAFAIPGAMARRFLAEVRVYGRMRHPRLGLRIDDVGSDVVSDRARTVRITEVTREGPATRAGLREGDLLLAVDGGPVARSSEVAYRVAVAGVEAPIALTIRRDGVESTIRVQPEEGE